MVVTYLLFLLTILHHFSQTLCHGLLRTDYYESFLRPIKCLMLSHYHVNGPQFLFATAKFDAYKYDDKVVQDHWNTFFKKVNRSCDKLMMFNTIIKDIKIINLKIDLYLDKYSSKIANIQYKFYKGIRAGYFQLWNENGHFSVHVKISDGVKKSSKELYPPLDIKPYLNLISKNRGDLCIENQFNDPTVITPKYVSDKPDGLITNFKVYLFLDGYTVGHRNYPAFECNKTLNYANKDVILIVDKTKFKIKLKALAIKFSEGKHVEKEYEFKLPYAESIYVNNMDIIPENTEKLYLIKSKLKMIECKDGTQRVAYLSNDDIIYHVVEYMAKNVTSYMERILHINRPLDGQC